ncbi:MAG: patatin-like phospholipase family protein [Gemmatimonadales bacterium]
MIVAVLAGGGAKAAAHIGAMRALQEARRAPDYFIGTSMGSVLAACFAAGLTPDETATRLQGVRRRDVARLRHLLALRGLTVRSMFDLDPLRETFERILPVRRFSDLRFPLTVTAVDLDRGDLLLFGAGGEDAPLLDVVLASCALPVFYPPVLIAGRRCADGGLRAVLGLEPASRLPADLVVAVDTGPGFDEPPAAPLGGPALIRAHNDATGILMAANTALQVEAWRRTTGRPPLVYVRPQVERHVTFRLDLAPRFAEEGYRATRDALARAGVVDQGRSG